MILKFKNYHIDTIVKVLNYPMTFQKGRIKMRFLNLLKDKQEICEKSRLEMLNEFSDKDEKGKPKMGLMPDAKGKPQMSYIIAPANQLKFNDEFTKLMNEDCPIDLPDSMKNDIPFIQNLIDSSIVELDNREINVLEQIYEILKGNEVKPEPKAIEENPKAEK